VVAAGFFTWRKTMSNNVEHVAEEAEDLAYAVECSLEELHDLLVEIEDEESDADPPTDEARRAIRAVEILQDAIGRWRSSLTDNDEDADDEDEDESASAPAPTSP
jgi:hypothetical protein